MKTRPSEDTENSESALSMETVVFSLLAVVVGTFTAVVLLPSWLPNLSASLVGTDPKAYWYLSRGSAFVALTLMWLAMALGLLITNKMARTWLGVPAAFAIHEFVSLLGLAFSLFHGLVLLGDHYINFTLAQVLMPFTTGGFKPLWVGLGQLGFYLSVIVSLSFYVRKAIGQKTWRAIHYISFFTYLGALIHGLMSGTDTSSLWAQGYYWLSGASLLFLLINRIVNTVMAKMSAPIAAQVR